MFFDWRLGLNDLNSRTHTQNISVGSFYIYYHGQSTYNSADYLDHINDRYLMGHLLDLHGKNHLQYSYLHHHFDMNIVNFCQK